ncbi:MAG: hypothetical protein ACK4UJ_07720 [Leptonema sp. (in: bacteria)]
MKKFFFIILLVVFSLYSENPYHKEGNLLPDTQIEQESELEWRDYDIPNMFPDLKILDSLDPKKSEKYLNSAKGNYDKALKIIKETETQMDSIAEQYKHLPENHLWQIKEKQEKIQKKQKEIKIQNYQKAKIYIIKGLEDLEQIKSEKIIKTQYYVNLKSNLLRHFVILQLSLNDFSGIINSIEEYFLLKEENRSEPQPYKILAYCYQFLENSSRKSFANSDVIYNYKKLKYKNLLQYVILKYGKDSQQYQLLKKHIEREIVENLL